MYVSSTEFKNNFGKYLGLCRRENVIITKHGKKLALLLHYPRNHSGYEAGEPIVEYGTSPKRRCSVTYQEFLEMTEKSDNRYEFIDGEVYQLASPGYTHQRILMNVLRTFQAFFDSREEWEPFVAPFDIELYRQPLKEIRELTEDDINVVQPDIMILCDPEKDINEKDRYKGTPAMVLEILSPSTRSRDLLKKGDLYMESGIREYWVVDPVNTTISIFGYDAFDVISHTVYFKGQTAESVIFKGLSSEVAW